jgi:ABC-type glycerol-3-phosphate transport system substrate-binding protein
MLLPSREEVYQESYEQEYQEQYQESYTEQVKVAARPSACTWVLWPWSTRAASCWRRPVTRIG